MRRESLQILRRHVAPGVGRILPKAVLVTTFLTASAAMGDSAGGYPGCDPASDLAGRGTPRCVRSADSGFQ